MRSSTRVLSTCVSMVMRSCNAARWEAARRDIFCEITEERNAGFRNNVVII